MNILPKKHNQFQLKQYWDRFYKKSKNTQNQYFQWYGSFINYKFIFQKIFKNQLIILNVGCGKSTLSQDIFHHFPTINIINCDYSQSIIQDMLKRAEQLKISNHVKYIVCDIMKLIPKEMQHKFDYIIDKGTLDAILSTNKKQNIKQINQIYFKNLIYCLKQFGSYLLISMLQPYILQTILNYFYTIYPSKIYIYQCCITNSILQPFLILIHYKIISQTIKIIYLNGNEIQFQSKQQIINKIKQLQILSNIGKNIKKIIPSQHLQYNIFNQKNNNQLRYQIHIIDHPQQKNISNTCSAIIVPQGKQHIDLYNTFKGLQSLVLQLKNSRIIVIKLVIGNQYGNLNQVKQQLNHILPQLIQQGCSVQKVPYLIDGNTLGSRQYVYQGDSIYIDEILNDGQAYRRLILKNNPFLIQSQFKLSYFNAKNHHKIEIQSQTLPKKKGMLIAIDWMYLDCGYARVIVTGILNLIDMNKFNQIGCKLLMLGGGGCAITKFIKNYFQMVQIVNVDHNIQIIKVAQKYFQIPKQCQNFQFIHSDAYQFIEMSKDEQFDIIIVDINGQGQNQLSPPLKYTNYNFIRKVYDCLKDQGLVVYNFIKEDITEEIDVFLGVKGLYPLYQYSFQDNNENHVIFGVKRKLQIFKIQQKLIIELQNNVVNLKLMKNRKQFFQWQKDILQEIKLIKPIQGIEIKIKEQIKEKKKNKKKKK